MSRHESGTLRAACQIAVDGPAGAGKSTVARILASRLGLVYIDTGAMYRACALKAIRNGVAMADEHALAKMMTNTAIGFQAVGDAQHIFLDGTDVSIEIRTIEVTKGSSDIAKSPIVRQKMVDLQRQIAKDTGVVMDGRDIGSHVLPAARFKFFLTARPETRACRRLLENRRQKTGAQDFQSVLDDIRYRDRQDSTRTLSPLLRAADAIEIDTSDLGIDAVVEWMVAYIDNAGNGAL